MLNRLPPASLAAAACALGTALLMVPAAHFLVRAPQPIAAVAAAATPEWPLRRHVQSETYFGLNDVNPDIPARTMAELVDIVDDDGFTAPHADAFKRAGGRIAIAYTDPTYVPYCRPPFRPPAGKCEGPVGVLVASDERAWFHDAHGERLHRPGSHGFSQEILNVASPEAQRAYARTTAAILAKSPRLDGFEADDSGGTFDAGADLPPGANVFGGFSGYAVEIRDAEMWKRAELQIFAAAGRPVIINGSGPDWQPAYGGLFIDSPNVMGEQYEGCFNNEGGYRYSTRNDTFRRAANGILTVQRHGKLAVCFPTGDTAPAHRLYAYAAWLLVYDPRTSVFKMSTPLPDGHAIYPETALVPRAPAATAHTSVDELRNVGVYVREFGTCAIDGETIGPCAAVVNASASDDAAIPALSRRYTRSIALDGRSLDRGGRPFVITGTPRGLAPTTAAILVR
jgi:hypothetical protein